MIQTFTDDQLYNHLYQGDMGQYWHLLFWKEISKDEYEAFIQFKKSKSIF